MSGRVFGVLAAAAMAGAACGDDARAVCPDCSTGSTAAAEGDAADSSRQDSPIATTSDGVATEPATTSSGDESPAATSGEGQDDDPATSDSSSESAPERLDADGSSDRPSAEPVDPDDSPAPLQPASARLTARPRGTTGAELGYWEYLPPGYGEGPVPLLVFTHGAAWQGDGSLDALQSLLEVGPVQLIGSDAWPSERPFVVLAPQNPRAGCFDPNDIDAFYRHALGAYDVDRSRIYHTGQSCGAIGAWGYLADHTDELVTAAVLISGDGRAAFDAAGCGLGRVAIWGLHNELDTVVPSSGTIDAIQALLQCDPLPDARLTIYPGESQHDAWSKTYDLSAGNDVYAWLLEHVHP